MPIPARSQDRDPKWFFPVLSMDGQFIDNPNAKFKPFLVRPEWYNGQRWYPYSAAPGTKLFQFMDSFAGLLDSSGPSVSKTFNQAGQGVGQIRLIAGSTRRSGPYKFIQYVPNSYFEGLKPLSVGHPVIGLYGWVY